MKYILQLNIVGSPDYAGIYGMVTPLLSDAITFATENQALSFNNKSYRSRLGWPLGHKIIEVSEKKLFKAKLAKT